jgi:pyrroloquinoline quinone biosynthesis protein B
MQVKILGTAAGGGFPQWNCACSNCRRLRIGSFPGKARTQLQVAVCIDSAGWFLLNVSPDIRFQIERSPFLHPTSGIRSTPIHGVVLTSAELDQSLGLLLLREFQPLQIYATASVGTVLTEDNSMFRMLQRVEQHASWNTISPGTPFQLTSVKGKADGLCCFPVSTSDRFPSYVSASRAGEVDPTEASLGLILQSQTGQRLGYFPAVGKVTDSLLRQFDSLDVLLFDGTFWSDDELIEVRGAGETAREMGHLPVGTAAGSLALLSELKCRRKIFVHINNTNPMLDESGPEYRAVKEAGWEVAEDGWELKL